MSAPTVSPRRRPRESRRERLQRLVAGTRTLFDERGVQDVPLEEIARLVGINRALVYRYVESKDELFVLAMTLYLDEITARGLERIDPGAPAPEQLRTSWRSFAEYCMEFPAFVDCAVWLMRAPVEELRARLSESTWLRIASSMSACLGVTEDILRRGAEDGTLSAPDPAMAVNLLYAETIGVMHLARLRTGVTRDGAGLPAAFEIAPEAARDAAVRAALLAAGLTA